MVSNNFINKDTVWALSDRGLDALNVIYRYVPDMDLAFELLTVLFAESEIYERIDEQN